MATLGELERSVMNLLWDTDEAMSANTLRDRIQHASEIHESSAQPPAITTLLTVLSRLEKKGMVTRSRESRPHRYRPVFSRAEHTAQLMNEVLDSSPDRDAVLARFVGTVTRGEAERLRTLLAERSDG